MTETWDRLTAFARHLSSADPPRFVDHPAWFFLFFVGMWLTVATLLGWISGHMALLARFPPQRDTVEESFGFATGKMRWVSYSSALYLGIGARGLHLAASWLFRPPFHRGIPCIPWREIRCVRPQGGRIHGWFVGSKFEILAAGIRFAVAGEAGRAIERKLAALGLAAAIDRPGVRA